MEEQQAIVPPPIHHQQQQQINQRPATVGQEIVPPVFILFIFILILSLQCAIQYWKKIHRKSYVFTTFILMWIFPISFILLFNPWFPFLRMILLWTIYSAVTIWLFKLSFEKQLAKNTPKKVYAWFLLIYKLSHASTMIGFVSLLIELLSGGVFFNWFHRTVLGDFAWLKFLFPVPSVWLFYGLYYGVLVRDCAEMCAEAMSNSMNKSRNQYYLSQSVMDHTCGVCSLPLKATSQVGSSMGMRATTGMVVVDSGDDHAIVNAVDDGMGDVEDDDVEGLMNMGNHSTTMDNKTRATTQATRSLACGHKFHEFCLQGWMLVGKKDVCPFCNEKIEFSDASKRVKQPWKSDSQIYIQVLELVRYLLVWNPIIVLAIHVVFVVYFFIHEHS